MINKLLVLIAVSFVLIGCDNAPIEITSDLFIGKWKCKNTMVKIITYDQKGMLIGDRTHHLQYDSFFINYEEEEDGVMMRQVADQKPRQFDFEKLTEITPYSQQYGLIDTGTETVITEKYIFTSNDKYKQIATKTVRYTSSKTNFSGEEYETICTRVKN